MSENKTIFYIFNLSKAVRNFGKGGVIEALVNQGFRVVAFGVRPDAREGIRRDFGDSVVFDDLGPTPHKGLARRVERLVTYIWRSCIDYQSVRIRHGSDGSFKLSLWLELAVGRILHLLPAGIWESLQERFAEWPRGAELVEKYQPSGIIITNPIAEENAAVNWLKHRGIHTAAMIESWDNLTIRGGLYAYPHDMFVWGDLMKNEAVNYHKMDPARVHGVGLPSFDIYWNHALYPTEAEWRRQMGIPAGAPVVSYPTSPSLRHNQQDVYLNLMLEAQKEGRLPANAIFLVRIHREDDPSVYEKWKANPSVRIQAADACLEGMDPDLGRTLMLAATMRYSHVMVNLFSTTVLDGMVNGTPSVCIAFDPAAREGGLHKVQRSIRRFLNDKHIKDIIAFGAVPVANNGEEMIAHLRAFLENKDHNLAERRRCLEATLARLDGRSAEYFASLCKKRQEEHYRQHPPRP